MAEAHVLDQIRNKKFCIVVWYRGDFCMYCADYMQSWAALHSSILDEGGSLVGVCAQNATRIHSACNSWSLPFRVLSDWDNSFSKKCRINLDQNIAFEHGMTQPAVSPPPPPSLSPSPPPSLCLC